MAGVTTISSTTISLASLPNSITANGNGLYDSQYGGAIYTNIILGFVYSIGPIYSNPNTLTINGVDTGEVVVGLETIYDIATPNVYPGGYDSVNFTSTDVNVNYTLPITGLLPNTVYYVRSYIQYDTPTNEGPFLKFGSMQSIQSSSGVGAGHGYYISNDTVGFYDPLQIRDASEGVEKVLTSDSSGLATWKPVKSLFTFGHYIGEKYGGGIVAAVWKEAEDEKVLIVSTEDVTTEEGSGAIGTITNIPYKMGSGTTLDNPGTSTSTNKFFTYHDLAGSGPYGGGNLQNVAIICIHNVDVNNVNEAGFLLSLNGTGGGAGLVPNEVAGSGFFTAIPGGYTYSSVIEKGLLRIKSTTTSVVNVFRVVGVGYYYPAMTTAAKYLAANYRIIQNTGTGTMGVFRIYVDYVGTETTPISSGAGQNVPDTQELVSVSFDSTGTGLNYQPITYLQDITWSAGTARTTAVGALGQSLYNGDLNSDAIIAQSNTLGTTFSAAKVCADYRGSGYDDWYLPSYFELNQVFNNAAIINKVLEKDSLGFLNIDYWTSTEYSTNTVIAFNSFVGNTGRSDYYFKSKSSAGRVRAVRKESVYTGDGLIMNLDATNKKSFSDVEYLNIGTSSKWKDLVNGGLTSSYSFDLSTHPTTSSGGTLTNILPYLGNGGSNPTGQVGGWYLTNISLGVPSTPKLYNNGGESSFVSNYFLVNYVDSRLEFQSLDQSLPANMSGATLNIYVSVKTGEYSSPYTLIKQVTDNTSTVNFVRVPLYSYFGKTISIKVTAPNASYTSSTQYVGPSFDEIYVRGTNGGYQATGPIYFPDESGFLRFNGQSTSGAYVDFKTTVGAATTVTVEAWVRLKPGYSGNMIFGWDQYDVYCTSGHLGFNTNNSDLYGISATQVSNLKLVDNWNHYVFEMKVGSALGAFPNYLSNNKIYINGNEQVLSNLLPPTTPNLSNINFNSGQGRIGGFKALLRYLMPMDISAFRIYNRALTKDEIMKNYSFEKKRYEIQPSLLTNNIFTSIDFDNTNSYSGDGTISGTASDLSGNLRNATLTISGTTTKPAVQRTSELYNGKEIIFPGTIATNPYLFWSNTIDFQGIQNLSISFWVKLTERRNSTLIVRWNTTGSVSGPWEVYQSLSTIGFRLKNSTVTVDKVGTKVIDLNKWVHVCATYDNTTKKIKTYIDSVLDINTSAPTTFTMATGIAGDVIVGRYSTAVNPFKGSFASIQIYNKSLSYGEVRNNYDADKFRFDNFTDANKFYSHEINGNPTFSISQNLSLELSGMSNEKVLKLNSSGYSVWTDKTALFTRPTNYRYIGELYGGGIIVAMWYYPKTIFNYLIMSLEDVSASSQWSNVTAAECNASSDFKGEDNQALIIGQFGHTTSAAKLCDDYAGGGFTDWYLPSVFEMNQAFNAGSIVDTVLGSDLLTGEYWTSTESSDSSWSAQKAFYYSFSEASVASVGYQKTGLKSSSKKVRAFRLATNAVDTNVWDPTWEEDYTPWWRGRRPWYEPTYWEMDWQPATYNEWDFDYYRDWRRTSVSIDVLPLVYQVPEAADNNTMYGAGYYYVNPQGYVSMTFSNTIYGGETILSSGVCWSNTSTTPTLSDNVVYSISGKTTTPNIMGTLPGTPWDTVDPTIPIHFVYLRAFVTTPSGTYYSSNSGAIRCTSFIGSFPSYYSTTLSTQGATYSTSPTTYATYPTGCLVFHRNIVRYSRS